jgi:putative Ig domain-containing protein
MKLSSQKYAGGRRVLALASLLVLAALTVTTSVALGAVSVRKASLNSGRLSVEGRGAKANATITVSSPESTATGRADSRGEFRFSASGFSSSTCKATVGDGFTSVVVSLSGCTVASPPPPPPPPPPSGAAPPTSLSLSHTSLSQVGTLATAGVTFAPNPPTPLDFAVQSSHPNNASVPASVHVERFSDPGSPVASFSVTYASAVSAPTQVTISVSAAGVTKSAVLTLEPPPAPSLAPGERGPGFVGSDFTTFATLGTTIYMSNGVGPLQVQITSGALPNGLSLVQPFCATPAKCPYVAISGTPTTVQTSTFTVKATDARGQTATGTFTIVINPARTLTITPEQWAPLTVGSFGNLWIDGDGGSRPYRWAITAGQLPPGMSLIQDNPNGPLVRVGGTPTTAGTFTFTLRLTDATNATVSRTFSVTVS